MEEAGNRGGTQHVGHMLVKQLLAAGVAGVELHGVVAQLLHNMFANSWNVSGTVHTKTVQTNEHYSNFLELTLIFTTISTHLHCCFEKP